MVKSQAILASVFLAVTVSTGQAADLNAVEKKLIDAAKAEGEVTFLNPLFSEHTGNLLQSAFVERYGLGPEFRVNNLRKGTGQVIAQVRQEIIADQFTVDVMLVSAPGFFDEAAERGAFASVESEYWKDSEALVRKSGQYSKYPFVVTPLAYTFRPVWNASCPGMKDFDATSYADVTQVSLKGKTIASDLGKSLTYTNTAISLRQNKAYDLTTLWKDLAATDPLIEFRTEPKMQMVISCERPLDMWNLSGRVYQNILKKPELKEHIRIGYYKEGQVLLGNQMAVMKGAPHPNVARLLTEFLLSKEGSDVFVGGEGVLSFRENYQPPANVAPYMLKLEEHKLLGISDWVAAADDIPEIRSEWSRYFQ